MGTIAICMIQSSATIGWNVKTWKSFLVRFRMADHSYATTTTYLMLSGTYVAWFLLRYIPYSLELRFNLRSILAAVVFLADTTIGVNRQFRSRLTADNFDLFKPYKNIARDARFACGYLVIYSYFFHQRYRTSPPTRQCVSPTSYLFNAFWLSVIYQTILNESNSLLFG